MRLSFFGTFFPEYQFAGNSSTGMVALLAQLPGVDSIEVYCQVGANIPPGLDSSKVALRPCWSHSNPVSLLQALGSLLRSRRSTDLYLFNTYVTGFGSTPLSNALGLLIPPILRLLTRRRVTVFMHNFVETQNVKLLGYNPGKGSRAIAHLLESILLSLTHVVVPLESQRAQIRAAFGMNCQKLTLPYIECVVSALRMGGRSTLTRGMGPRADVRILLFGAWGPQKDLAGAVASLSVLTAADPRVTVTIAGEANKHFPDSEQMLRQTLDSLPSTAFQYRGRVDEDEVLDLMASHDILVLPYLATGGYSGTMNCGAFVGMQVIAYDLPQLRESASDLGVVPVFVQASDSQGLLRALTAMVASIRIGTSGQGLARPMDQIAIAKAAVARLLQLSS